MHRSLLQKCKGWLELKRPNRKPEPLSETKHDNVEGKWRIQVSQPFVNASYGLFCQLDINSVEELIPSIKKYCMQKTFGDESTGWSLTASACFSTASGQHASNHAAHYIERDHQPSWRPLYSSCRRFNATSSRSVHPGEAMWSRASAGRSIFYFFSPLPSNQYLHVPETGRFVPRLISLSIHAGNDLINSVVDSFSAEWILTFCH